MNIVKNTPNTHTQDRKSVFERPRPTDEQLAELLKAGRTPFAQAQAPAEQPGPTPAIKPGSFARLTQHHYPLKAGAKLLVVNIENEVVEARVAGQHSNETTRMHRIAHHKLEPWEDPVDLTKTIYPDPTFRGMTASQILDFLAALKKLAIPPAESPSSEELAEADRKAIDHFTAELVSTFSRAVDAGCIPPNLFPICRNIIVDHARVFLLPAPKNKVNTQFKVGDQVVKNAGDYTFRGIVVAVFSKTSGAVRLVVENPEGILHIFSEKNLTLVTTNTK